MVKANAAILTSLGTGRLNDDGDTVSFFIEPRNLKDDTLPSVQEEFEPLAHGQGHCWESAWSQDHVQKTVDLWNLSPVERLNLEELGNRLQDMMHHKNTPSEVIRFLLACAHSVPRSEDMFRKSIEWRIRNNVDRIVKDYFPPQELFDYFPGAVLEGLDKEGDPVLLCRTGVTDTATMLRRYGKQEMIQHAIWLREMIFTGQWAQDYERKHGRAVKRVLIIEDLHALPLLQIAANGPLISLYGEVMRLDQDNFPEAGKKLLVIRAPSLFKVIWNVVKHFFDPGVRSKMVFCGPSDFREVLLEYVDLEILPDCVVPGIGVGKPIIGMPPRFEGGPLPRLE
jgi:hypothetical protein